MATGKAKWIDEMVHAMLSPLLQSVKEEECGENGFKKEAWDKGRIAANAVYGSRYFTEQGSGLWMACGIVVTLVVGDVLVDDVVVSL